MVLYKNLSIEKKLMFWCRKLAWTNAIFAGQLDNSHVPLQALIPHTIKIGNCKPILVAGHLNILSKKYICSLNIFRRQTFQAGAFCLAILPHGTFRIWTTCSIVFAHIWWLQPDSLPLLWWLLNHVADVCAIWQNNKPLQRCVCCSVCVV